MVHIHRTPKARKVFVVLFTVCLSLSYLSSFFEYTASDQIQYNSELKASPILETENTPINEDGAQPVGNITVETLNYLKPGIMDPLPEINPAKIHFTYLEYDWLGVEQAATGEIQGLVYWKGNIEIRLNESVEFEYEIDDTATILAYKPELSIPNKGDLISMNINSTLIDLDEVEISKNGGFVYNYSSWHDLNPEDTLRVDYVYDYNITIKDWRIFQKNYNLDALIEPTYLDLYNQTYMPTYYTYTFQMGEYLESLQVDLLVNLPDIDYLSDIRWEKRFNLSDPIDFENTTQLSNSTFRFTDIDIDTKIYIGHFETNHTIEVVNEFSDYWSKDYLFTGKVTRIREFDISVVDGPPTIGVSNYRLNLTEFLFDEVIEVTSAFGRNVTSHDLKNEGANGTRLDFPLGEGLEISTEYFLVLDEIDTIVVKYTVPSSLAIKVVDKINNPLRKADVKLNFGNSTNATYGTMISEELVIPYAYKITSSLGMVYYPDVPRGNYTVDVFYNGKQVAFGIPIDTYTNDIVVFSLVPHFPTWMIIFASTSALIGIVGYIIMKKAQF